MQHVLDLQKTLMRLTMDCFHTKPSHSIELLNSKGEKIKIPSFLDDDELFADEDEEKFSSLQPSGREHSTPMKQDLLKYRTVLIDNMLQSVASGDGKRYNVQRMADKYQDVVSEANEGSLS